AIAVGFIINLVVKRSEPLNHKDEHAHEHTHKHGEHEHEHDEHEHDEHEHDIAAKGCCRHGIGDKRSTFKKLVLHPLLHSAKICLYIFIVTFAFGFIFNGLIGKEKVEAFLSATLFLQPLFTAVVGLIPNCASSVVIAQLYVDGALSLGGAITGLTLNSGLGVAVLLKDSKNVKKSLIILAVMLVLSLFIGYLVTAVSVLL
ncbi:MAG: arsenic efflux protein, partial [Clostridia bacterium]|nr:arsenic efflux protein [Clostridia bacterium]